MKIGSLFSGIGGLELGLERAGLGPVLWQCEIDPFCRAVLAKHWPNVTRFEDVTRPRNYPHVDIICGGFPCQDVSPAGRRRGIGGARSGLWWHFARVVDQVRPRYVVVENVAGGAKAWLPHVGSQLGELGYRARAFGISAFDVGAPHFRRRVFVLARHTARLGRKTRLHRERTLEAQARSWEGLLAAIANGRTPGTSADSSGEPVRLQQGRSSGARGTDPGEPGRSLEKGAAPDADGDERRLASEQPKQPPWRWSRDGDRWTVEPPICGVAHGVPRRVDRLRCLGNAVVPHCAEVVGRIIRAEEEETSRA